MKRLVILLSYWIGIDWLFYRLNRTAKRIFTFHNVLPDELCESIPPIGVSMSLSTFRRTVDQITKAFKCSTDIDDCTTATITFDDGTLNEYSVAGKELMRRNVPAILFLTGDIVGAKGSSMPVIEQVCVWAELVPLDVAIDLFGPFKDRIELWQKHVQPGFRSDAAHKGRQFLSKLNQAYPVDKILESLPQEWREIRMSGVSNEDVTALKKAGWLIGWHTQSHFPLGFLDIEERRMELECPPEMKNVVLGYPYGDIVSVGVETPRLAKEMGYPAAVSNFSAKSPHYSRHFMLRMAPPADKYEFHFLASGLKYFLQTQKLLPTHR